MKRKTVCLSVCVAALMTGGLAHAGSVTPAAPAPQAQLPTWDGFFLGAHAGWGKANTSSATHSGSGFGNFLSPNFLNGILDFEFRNNDLDGFIGGAQVGYNVQSSRVIWGLVADLSMADISDSDITTFGPFDLGFFGEAGPFGIGADTQTNFLATARGRVGYLVTPRILPYIHGGLAVQETETRMVPLASFGPMAGLKNKDVEFGWVIGAGVEAKLDDRVSFFAEYSYMDFGSSTSSFDVGQGTLLSPLGTVDIKNSDQFHAVKVGINIQIGR